MCQCHWQMGKEIAPLGNKNFRLFDKNNRSLWGSFVQREWDQLLPGLSIISGFRNKIWSRQIKDYFQGELQISYPTTVSAIESSFYLILFLSWNYTTFSLVANWSGWRIGLWFISRLMGYLQKTYNGSMVFMEMGIPFHTFCFHPDLQQLYFMTMFNFSSKTHYKLRYKRSIVHNYITLYLNLHLELGLTKGIISL